MEGAASPVVVGVGVGGMDTVRAGGARRGAPRPAVWRPPLPAQAWAQAWAREKKARLDFARLRRSVRSIMSTVVEIEAAIGKLPFEQQRDLFARWEERQMMRERADTVFQMYDREENGKAESLKAEG